ncbi:arginine repressor C-terminal-like domain-containing protein [Tanacetum coccineum]
MVIKDFYGDDGCFSSSAAAHRSNGVWVDIIKAVSIIDDIVPSFRSSFVLKFSNGSSISFWKDAWCNNITRLMDLYPRLYALETNKECRVNDSFGGRIFPRPSEGKLRYMGGITRIISVNKNLDYRELVMNTLTIWNKPHTIKYQLPDEDLDALISTSSRKVVDGYQTPGAYGGYEGMKAKVKKSDQKRQEWKDKIKR